MSNQCVEKRESPLFHSLNNASAFLQKINAVLFFRTVLSLIFLTFQKPLSETTLARFLQQLPLLYLVIRVHKCCRLSSGEACNSRVYLTCMGGFSLR